ncbi:MAG: DUF2071 domain-containing protein [Chloroflexi bacterium]|nr:DUF2071 domain-containing protein [Chloroflexota bacterium]
MIPAGYQNWRRLLFVHWPVSAAALRPLVPSVFSIDQYDGSAYVSLVPFVIEAARPFGAPAALGLRFLETNVRTYVHLENGERSERSEPGVFFFSLDAASVLAVIGARVGVGLPYYWATGRERRRPPELEYAIRRRGTSTGCYAHYVTGPFRGPASPGSLDHFLVERYILHAQRGPTIWSVRVHHQPYPLYEVQLRELRANLLEAAGLPNVQSPVVAHFASGVDVAIEAPRIRPRYRA